MAEISSITARAAFIQFALTTIGIDPAWDKALHTYLRAETLQNAFVQFGAMAQITNDHFYLKAELQKKFGPDWHQQPEALAFKVKSDAVDAEWNSDYCEPFWRAARELTLTPPPSIAAVTFKAAMIERDEVWNDKDFPASCMKLLHEDFARLAREA